MAKSHATTTIPPEHLVYLQRRPFNFDCSTAVFPPEELQALKEYGNWLEALASGAIAPVTAEQEHFLRVDREEAKPTTVSEQAWVRLKGRREYEKEEGQQPLAPPPPENYGIVEWDEDRCWW
jgi:uncharacterized protein YifE (UPF0438 family)